MTATPRVSAPALPVTHEPWEAPLSRPQMSNEVDSHDRYSLTNRYVERDGVPFIPVSGEMHYSRVPRREWAERLQLMKSGGVTVVASYMFWIHHEETRGQIRFDDNLDVRGFVELCASLGLDVVLRVGPWCHGEARNGGFPDWVQAEPVVHRTDDPAYLELVRPWFTAISEHLTGLFGPASPIIAIQIENELYDQPAHIVTLKQLAREVGMSAPIWTATGWGGAELPDAEVMPLFGGYADGFWVNYDAPWDTSFHEHFFFSHVWDDPGIGADLRAHAGIGGGAAHRPPRTPSALFPAATCELGGGMATAYHRRPRLTGRDIAAVAHNKIGNGSAWQGYYMYAGGTNPAGTSGMQESHATGYPNDLARFDYDFAAPVGATGRINETHAQLRRQHAFLRAFGEVLAPMPSTLPAAKPNGIDDVTTLRWALRSDGTTGFVFISWHQPFVPLADYPDAQFQIRLDDTSTLEFPDRPVTIPAGTLAHWPVNLTVGGVQIAWATASALTVLDGEVPTLVLAAEAGIDVRIVFGGGVTVSDAHGATVVDGIAVVDDGATAVLRATSDSGELDVLIIPSKLVPDVWVPEGPHGRELVLSPEPLWLEGDRLTGRHTGSAPAVHRYHPQARHFVPVDVEQTSPARPFTPVTHVRTAATTQPPASYGSFDARASAPSEADFAAYADTFLLEIPEWTRQKGELTVAWAGDVARLLVDGVVVADQLWSGGNWDVDLRQLPDGTRVELQILPLHPGAQVNVPAAAAQRRRAVDGTLCVLDEIGVSQRGRWRESRD